MKRHHRHRRGAIFSLVAAAGQRKERAIKEEPLSGGQAS